MVEMCPCQGTQSRTAVDSEGTWIGVLLTLHLHLKSLNWHKLLHLTVRWHEPLCNIKHVSTNMFGCGL